MCNLMEREPRQQIDYITTWNSITFPHVTMKRRFDANRNFSNQYLSQCYYYGCFSTFIPA